MAKWERMWARPDNQEVGLEAATLERKRNSSLVERARAENTTGLKPRTEDADCDIVAVVGEHSRGVEAVP